MVNDMKHPPLVLEEGPEYGAGLQTNIRLAVIVVTKEVSQFGGVVPFHTFAGVFNMDPDPFTPMLSSLC